MDRKIIPQISKSCDLIIILLHPTIFLSALNVSNLLPNGLIRLIKASQYILLTLFQFLCSNLWTMYCEHFEHKLNHIIATNFSVANAQLMT